jgi:sterol desaturase/sphingolipid hydroxylase (fatty acid hydroxylase superfamily)
MNPVDWLVARFGDLQQLLYESVVQPLLFGIGLGNVLEEAYRATGWLLMGLVQIGLLLTVFRALERWRPVEAVTDRQAVRVDVIYSLIHRLGLFRLAMFFTLDALVFDVNGELRLLGWQPLQIDALWPGVTDGALVSFLLYLVLFDFVDYWIHRGQHAVEPWWQLHALHHSQRQLTMWSDNRNHLLDDLIRELIFASVALAVGIGPGQFVAVVACTQLIESLSHANVRLSFGPVFGRLLVSPAYHRLHHAIGLGHESHGQGSLGGHNFAVLFPVWDLLFGTAQLQPQYHATGLRDQLPADGRPGRDYGRGFWAQQWLGLKRLTGRA